MNPVLQKKNHRGLRGMEHVLPVVQSAECSVGGECAQNGQVANEVKASEIEIFFLVQVQLQTGS